MDSAPRLREPLTANLLIVCSIYSLLGLNRLFTELLFSEDVRSRHRKNMVSLCLGLANALLLFNASLLFHHYLEFPT
jgi:hypothetical protein